MYSIFMFIVIRLESSEYIEPCQICLFILLKADVFDVVPRHPLSDVTRSLFAYWCFWVIPAFQSSSDFLIISSQRLVDKTNLLINTDG